MNWKKSSPELVEIFASLVPEPAEARKMFGYPAAFANGNLFMALHEENFILRLPQEEISKMKGARPFAPVPGRKMKEYVVAPKSLVKNRAALRKWVNRSLEYVLSLPAKAKAKAKKAKSSRPRNR